MLIGNESLLGARHMVLACTDQLPSKSPPLELQSPEVFQRISISCQEKFLRPVVISPPRYAAMVLRDSTVVFKQYCSTYIVHTKYSVPAILVLHESMVSLL